MTEMPSSTASLIKSKSARMIKLCSLASVVYCISAAIPLTNAAATSHRVAESNLTAEHWQEMHYDRYLRTYPDGTKMNLGQYVDHLSLPEPFECGVGKLHSCKISTLGQSLEGPDWHILFATSVWNSYTNSLVQALSQSITHAKAVFHDALKDFVYDYNPQTTSGWFTATDLLNVLLVPIHPGGNHDPRVSEETHELDWMAAIKPIVKASSQHPSRSLRETTEAPMYTRMKRHLLSSSANDGGDIPLIHFNSTQPAETNLSELSQQLHSIVVQSIENKINSPISLETGIYSALEHGRFASPKVEPARLSKKATSLLTISALLNLQNAMLLVRKSLCSQYREKLEVNPSRLEFCASDDTLFEIVLVNEDEKIVGDIYNAHLVHDKYGFKTSFLASEALRCQQSIEDSSRGKDAEDDVNSPYEPCTFQLPICNLTDKKYQKMWEESGDLIRTCREVGVPI